MKGEGVFDLHKRSVENYNIWYNPFIGDDDSSSYSAVDKERPYGAMVFIQKQECLLIFEVFCANLRVRMSKKHLLTSEKFS